MRLLIVAAVVVVACGLANSTATAAIALVQKSPVASAGGTSITPTFSAGTTSGDLLVATIEDLNSGCATDSFSAPAGWVRAVHTCRGANGPIEIWYLANASAGVTSVVFNTGSNGANSVAQLSEWSGAATSGVLDQTGTSNTGGSSTSLTVTTSAAIAAANELAITAFETSSGLSSFTPGASWNSLASQPGSGFDSDYRIGPSSGSTLTESVTSNPQTVWGAGIATFFPACGGGSLTLETSPTVTFPSVTLNGYNATSSVNVAFTLDDETGTGSGWNLNATSTTLTAAGGKTLPTTSTRFTAVASASAAAGNCSMPTNSVSYPVTLPAGGSPPTAAEVYNAAANSGKGPVNVTLTAQVSLPGNAKAGSYSSTWTMTLSSGP